MSFLYCSERNFWFGRNLELIMKRPSTQIGLGIALGAGIGAAIAGVLGSGGAWLAIGVAIGVVIGWAMSKRKAGPALRWPQGSSTLEAVRKKRGCLCSERAVEHTFR